MAKSSEASPSLATASAQSQQNVESVAYYKREPRLTAWVCLFSASIIALTAVLEELGGGFGPAEWVLVVTVISTCASLLAVSGYHWFKRKFVGTIWGEGISSYLLLLFWIGGISVALSPGRGLAVTSTEAGLNVVVNANLYFSCWLSFGCNVYICASWTMNHWKKAEKLIRDIVSRLAKWWFLFLTSIVLLVSSVQFYYSQNCSAGGETPLSHSACVSNNYAVSLGACASLMACITIILAHVGLFPFIVESILTLLMFMLYTAGIAVITYKGGSGITIGNIYFSTWTGFILSVLLGLDCYHVFMKKRAKRKADLPPSEKKKSCFSCCCQMGDSDSDDEDDDYDEEEQEVHVEPSPNKKKATKTKSKKKKTSSPKKQTPQQFQSVPMTRNVSTRSSIHEDEFADARDDLELKL